MTWAEQDVGGGHLTVEVAVRNMKAAPKPLGRFSHTWKSHRRDRTGWLGREDSNLGIAGVAHMLTATTTTADSQAH